MRHTISGTALICAVGLFLSVSAMPTISAAGQEAAEDVAISERYLQAALEAEVAGRSQQRDDLLQRASRVAPDHPPARWHLGQVRIDDRWQSIKETQRQMAGDPRIRKYRELRDTHAGSVDGELALARWCRSQDLDAEARAHWLQVLQLQPDNQVAARASDMRWYHGSLLSHEQIEDLKSQARRAARDMKRWKPTMIRWRRAIEDGDADQCENALGQLHALAEPAAIGALEEVFSDQRRGKQNVEVSLEAVAVLARMDHAEATASLVRHAVLSSSPEVRTAAAESLSRRPLHAYVPVLLTGMASPIEATSFIYRYPNTSVVSRIALYQEGPWEDRSIGLGTSVRLTLNRGARDYAEAAWARNALGRATRRAVRDAAAATAQLKAAVMQANAHIETTNEKIDAALSRATGVELDAQPRSWWAWWNDYNELFTSPNKPVRHREYLAYFDRPVPNYGSSCFDRGTLVWTLTGKTPIEQIHVGDRVLSQNPRSGELAFKPVIGTTVRPASELTAIGIDSDRVSATLGHPLWVSGRGWRMVKNLSTGMSLHGVSGSRQIDSLAEDGRREAFNLIVADFNNYFVGRHGLLAHDNTLRRPTAALLPGLPAGETR